MARCNFLSFKAPDSPEIKNCKRNKIIEHKFKLLHLSNLRKIIHENSSLKISSNRINRSATNDNMLYWIVKALPDRDTGNG